MTSALAAQIQIARFSPEQAAARLWAQIPATSPVDPVQVAKTLGAQVGDLAEGSVHHATLEFEPTGEVWLKTRATAPAAARRFALAHLLGHWLLGHGPWQDGGSSFTATGQPFREQQANAFAAALLIPRAHALGLVHGSRLFVDDMAVHFQVSRALMEMRLKQLGIIG